MNARERAVAHLERDRAELARAITDALYAELPGLHAKYGERGRMRCLEDMSFNLEHLQPAVALDRPTVFEAYVRWLDGLLRSRGVDTSEIDRSLVLTERILRDRMTGDEMEAVTPSLQAGRAALAQGGA